MQQLKLIVSGDVQGVGYRWACYERAKRYGLTGYAKNLKNGNVEILVEGPGQSVEEFLSDVRTGNMPGYTEDMKFQLSEISEREFDSFTAE